MRLALEAAKAGTWDWDILSGRVHWSPSYYRLYGLEASTTAPGYENWLSCIHPGDRARVDALARRSVARCADFAAEYRILHPEGERWVRAVGRTEAGAGGQPTRMVGIALDVTERKKAQVALRESEERYRSLVRASAVVVWTTSADGRFTAPQPGWEEYTGQRWPVYCDWGGMEMIHPEELLEVSRRWGTAIKQRIPFEAEYRLWHAASGAHRWCEVRAVPLLNAAGAVREWVGTVTDIDRRKRLEQEREQLLEREHRARVVAEERERTQRFLADLERCMQECPDVPTLASTVTRALGRLLGVARCSWGEWDEAGNVHIYPDYCEGVASIAGTYPLSAFGEALIAPLRRGLPVVIADVQTDPSTADAREVFAQLSVRAFLSVPLLLGGRCVASFAVQSVTGPRQWTDDEVALLVEVAERTWLVVDNLHLAAQTRFALERAREARAQAEAANRAKDDFLALLSHELRTPLNPIIGWTQMLRRGKLDPPQQARALEVIERNARLQNQLIADLLDVSRIERGKFNHQPQPVAPGAVVHAAVEAVRSLAEDARVELHVAVTEPLPVIEADPTRLSQVVWNLLTNAVKFTPAGGRVDLQLEALPAGLRLTVSDSGLGITPAFLPHLFERFCQADDGSTRKSGGLGLGLFIVRHIVELHGGRVWATSDGENRGATFIVELPVPAPGGQAQ